MTTKKVIDAEFEVIRGPSPVHWQAQPRKAGVLWYQWVYGGLIVLVAGYTLLLGLAGADLDTRDAVAADAARAPVAAALP
jgi:hypothetical protein